MNFELTRIANALERIVTIMEENKRQENKDILDCFMGMMKGEE